MSRGACDDWGRERVYKYVFADLVVSVRSGTGTCCVGDRDVLVGNSDAIESGSGVTSGGEFDDFRVDFDWSDFRNTVRGYV